MHRVKRVVVLMVAIHFFDLQIITQAGLNWPVRQVDSKVLCVSLH